MAVADSWEYTWRSEMIVGNNGDDEVEVDPAMGLTARVGLLVLVCLVGAGALTAHVRLHVLRAEQRRLQQEIADVKTDTEFMRCRVAGRAAEAVTAAEAGKDGLEAPVTIDEMGPPTVGHDEGRGAGNTVGEELRDLSRSAAEDMAQHMGAVLRGPPTGP